MVRLVFRPYTQIRRTICTSVSLRASTRVSPGFALLRHSSPSFGSQQICSYSNLSRKDHGRSMLHQTGHTSAKGLHFHSASGFATQTLAYMLDSLVRVSRRVESQDHVKLHNSTSDRVPQNQGTCPKVVPRNGKNSQISSLMPHSLHKYQNGPTTQARPRTERFSSC